ncbi:MAG TPA: pitrilysin family protein, partial [Thermoplasmata archaeon]|nr:pitrilysin family protein [Thermoplasmata archaeon]
GLAFMTSQLTASGAGRRNRIELARELDRRGATLSSRCDPESQEVSLWGPSESFGPLIEILGDAVRAPRFDGADIERVRRQCFEHQLRELTQPKHRAERELLKAIFPIGHPYRLTGLGSRSSVSKIRRADLVRFHRDHFTRDGSQLIVTTAFPGEELRRELRRHWPRLDSRPAPAAPSSPGSRPHPPREVTVETPGRSQVEVLIGGPSIPRGSPDFPAAFLANELLGGRPLLGRLFQRVRESHGLAYHASSELETMRWGGHWLAQAGTGPERVQRVLPLLLDEVDRLGKEAVRPAELNRVRTSAIGEIPLSLETTAGAHELAVEVAYYDLPTDFYRTWPSTLNALTSEEVRAGAEHALGRVGASTVVVGPAR